jgi:hypothetical protein
VPSSDDFGVYYFTSNDYVKDNFHNFEWHIIAEFYSKQDAYEFESQLLKEFNNDKCINHQKYKKFKKYSKINIENIDKVCALPGCGKIYNNWRAKCCCPSHSKKYAGYKRHIRK